MRAAAPSQHSFICIRIFLAATPSSPSFIPHPPLLAPLFFSSSLLPPLSLPSTFILSLFFLLCSVLCCPFPSLFFWSYLLSSPLAFCPFILSPLCLFFSFPVPCSPLPLHLVAFLHFSLFLSNPVFISSSLFRLLLFYLLSTHILLSSLFTSVFFCSLFPHYIFTFFVVHSLCFSFSSFLITWSLFRTFLCKIRLSSPLLIFLIYFSFPAYPPLFLFLFSYLLCCPFSSLSFSPSLSSLLFLAFKVASFTSSFLYLFSSSSFAYPISPILYFLLSCLLFLSPLFLLSSTFVFTSVVLPFLILYYCLPSLISCVLSSSLPSFHFVFSSFFLLSFFSCLLVSPSLSVILHSSFCNLY